MTPTLLLLAMCGFGAAHAQQVPRSLRISPLDQAALSPQVIAASRADALEVNLTREQIEADPASHQALDQWVREGGVVLLHTDAAQLFGYTTMPARLRKRELAGQLFGRARNALFFGQHPALWGEQSQALEGPTFGQMGVRVVFYQMAPGDHLALAHPDGVPLLRVTDMALPELPLATPDEMKLMKALGFQMSDFNNPISARVCKEGSWPLLVRYACAMAPWGKGWALMMPRHIETQRADGQRFVQNLDRLLGDLRRTQQWAAVPSAPLQRAMDRIKRARRVDWARVAQEIRDGMQSTSSEWSEEEVRAMFVRDRDQTLLPEEVKGGFNPEHWKNRNDIVFYTAVANAVEQRHRNRLLTLAQSKFKVVSSATELKELLTACDTAAAEQKQRGEQPEALQPGDEFDDTPVTTATFSEGKADVLEAANQVMDTDSPDHTGAVPLTEDERLSPAYQQAAALTFLMVGRARLHSSDGHIGRREWLNAQRNRSLGRDKAWLWRGLLSAACADSWQMHAYGRVTYLNDAIASWQRALRVHFQNESAQGEEAQQVQQDAVSPFDAVAATPGQSTFGALSGGDMPDSPTASVLDAENDNPDHQSTLGGEDSRWQESNRWLEGEIAGVPCRQIQKWIQEGLRLRHLILREPPLGGHPAPDNRLNYTWIAGERIQIKDAPMRTFAVGNGSTPLSAGGYVAAWYGQAGGGLYPARASLRGFIENKADGPLILAALKSGRSTAKLNRNLALYAPLTDEWKQRFIGFTAPILSYHQSRRLVGWGTDTLDIMLFPGSGAARALYQTATRSTSSAGPYLLRNDGAFDGRGALAEVGTISPVLSPLGVTRTLALQTATGGRVIGTRMLLSTALVPNYTDRRSQIRMAVGLPASMARMYAQVLLNSMLEGGDAPAWMRDGLMNLCRLHIAEVLTTGHNPTQLRLGFGADDRVRSPQPLDEPNALSWSSDAAYLRTAAEIVMIDRPDTQPSTRALQALYKRYGKGAVTEIFQRLGAGQSSDEAFLAVTGMTEANCLDDLTRRH